MAEAEYELNEILQEATQDDFQDLVSGYKNMEFDGAMDFDSDEELSEIFESDTGFELEANYESDFENLSFENSNFDLRDSFDDDAELELLARELMEIETEMEYEQFLGKLLKRGARKLKRAAKKVGRRAFRKVGRLGGGLIRKALPMVGSALGNMVLPGVGGALGGSLFGGLAGKAGGLLKGATGNPLMALFGGGGGLSLLRSLLGKEYEASQLSEVQLEVAKQVISTIDDAIVEVGNDSQSEADPDKVVKRAFQNSVGRNMSPGIRAAMTASAPAAGGAESGQWVRKNGQIILLGA